MSAATRPDDMLDWPVDRLALGIRWLTVLERDRIRTVRDLIGRTESQLRRAPGIGRVSMEVMRAALEAVGLRLHDPEVPAPVLPFPTVHQRLARIEQRLAEIEHQLHAITH